MYFIGLLSGLKKNQINSISKSLGLGREEIKIINSYSSFLVKLVKRLSKEDMAMSQIYRSLHWLSREVILLIKAKANNKTVDLNIKRFFRYCRELHPYISGKDLVNLGLKPSPDYKKLLDQLLYLQLDRRINSRQEALRWVKQYLAKSGERN